MKLLLFLLSTAFLAGAFLTHSDQENHILILTGNTLGYMAPCGCSDPMLGGIKRRATAIRQLSAPGRTTILDNNAFVADVGRQSEIKAETLSQLDDSLNVTAINFGASEAKLGPGMLLQLTRLSGGRFLTSSLRDAGRLGLRTSQVSGPFMIGGISTKAREMAASLGSESLSEDQALEALATANLVDRKALVIMLDGDHDDALRLQRRHPALALIQYNSVGRPSQKLEMVGRTALVTSGEKGKYLVRLEYRDGDWSHYQVVGLGPEVGDDGAAKELYSTYLKRVDDEHLLEQVPRSATASYAGSWSCVGCHSEATKVWKNSHHRFALNTLERVGHSRDPDCVSCHVVGLESTKGFRDRKTTPALAGVGCESCHGPALAHAKAPTEYKLKKIDQKSCVGCHNPENSPNFNFATYWKRVRH